MQKIRRLHRICLNLLRVDIFSGNLSSFFLITLSVHLLHVSVFIGLNCHCYTEPEGVQNFTAIIVNNTHVQLFWLAEGHTQQYTVFWLYSSKVGVAVHCFLVSTNTSYWLSIVDW